MHAQLSQFFHAAPERQYRLAQRRHWSPVGLIGRQQRALRAQQSAQLCERAQLSHQLIPGDAAVGSQMPAQQRRPRPQLCAQFAGARRMLYRLAELTRHVLVGQLRIAEAFSHLLPVGMVRRPEHAQHRPAHRIKPRQQPRRFRRERARSEPGFQRAALTRQLLGTRAQFDQRASQLTAHARVDPRRRHVAQHVEQRARPQRRIQRIALDLRRARRRRHRIAQPPVPLARRLGSARPALYALGRSRKARGMNARGYVERRLQRRHMPRRVPVSQIYISPAEL